MKATLCPSAQGLAGSAGAFVILAANLLLWSGCWIPIVLPSAASYSGADSRQ
jgi:hypothetical protein